MKRCPECRRDYYDDTLLYCLDDGNALLEGPATGSGAGDEPATAILHETAPSNEAATRAQIHMTDQTAVLPTGTGAVAPKAGGFDKRLIAAPLLLGIIVLAAYFGYRYFNAAGSGQINSIAVLPFANATGDKETDFLADGIAETLINNFTRIPELKVAARSTAFSFRGRESEIKTIGSELGVGSILTGRLMQRGDQLSVQVDLINTSDGSQIWGNRYQGKTSEIVNIQQRIATDVSSQLKLKLTGAQSEQIAKTYTQNAKAYQHYLRGRFFWNKRSSEGLQAALLEFQRAIDLDPNYAIGYVGLADCYSLMEEHAGIPASENLPKAKAAAMRALEIDETLAEAHASLAYVYMETWQWADAEREFRRSISLHPNYPTAHHWFSNYLRTQKRLDEALAEIRRAQELDPLSPIISNNLGNVHLLKNEVAAAIEQYERVIQLDPEFPPAHANLGYAYLQERRYDDAIAEIQKAVDASGGLNRYLSDLGYAYGIAGRRREALEILKRLEEKDGKREAAALDLAKLYAGLGETDKAFENLEKDFRRRSGRLQNLNAWWLAFGELRSDPRYADLVRRIGLPE